MYAILNYIMNIAARASTLSEIGTAGGLTIANYMGVSEANGEMKLLAGYLSVSIPFICIAIVKGVGTFVHLAGQMTGTSVQAAGSAAAEASSGNFSFGNVSMRNRQSDNMSQLQRNFSSSLSAGGHTLDTGGVQIRNDAGGFSTINHAVSSGSMDFSMAQTDAEEFRKGYDDSMQRAYDAATKYSQSESVSHNESAKLAHSFSDMSVQDISHRYNMGADKAQQIAQNAKVLDQHYNGHSYTDQTKAAGNLSFGANIGGGISSGVESGNAVNHGDSGQASTSQDIAETQRRFDSYMQDVADSDRNDEVTQLAKDHVNTLSKMNQYSQDRAYNERMARNYQESYHRASSLTFSERNNLMDHALEIATKEGGYTQQEASKMMASHNAADKETAREWFNEAKSRESVRMRPASSSMKQPDWGNYNGKSAQNEFRNEFSESKQQAQNRIAEHSKKMNAKGEDLSFRKEIIQDAVRGKTREGDVVIAEKGEEITNKQHIIRQKEEKRSKDGAAVSAAKHGWKTLNPLSDDKE
jgi:hypothetical protein